MNDAAPATEVPANIEPLIADCADHMLRIKDERKTLNEEATEIRQRLREAGVQTDAFNYALRMKELEDEAQASYFASLRECFGALGIGDQSSLFDAPPPA